jgi:16S rRNA (guanine(966)-N(2))-methyltransferase RsmD
VTAGAKHPFKKRNVPEPIPPQHRSVHGIRIIGGQFRGRRLIYNGFVTVRPMRDRVREALFAHLGDQIEGMHVFDLFAGTGAMGLEALSRGAKHVTFVERHLPTLQSIRENVALLGVEDRCELVFGDCFIWGKRLLAPPSSNPWLVFVCPPYAYFHTHRRQLSELLSKLLELAPPGSILVTESDDHYHGEDLPQLVSWEKREYGQTVLWIAKKPADPLSQEPPGSPNPD